MKFFFFSLIFLSQISVTAKVPTIAVATNFNHAMNSIVEKFERKYKKKIQVSYGSTGSLYSQITLGAPFDAFFSADTKTIDLLIKEDIGIKETKISYALGSLVFLCEKCPRPFDWREVIAKSDSKIAIANPKLAPYGQAANEVVESLRGSSSVRERFVFGSSIGQAFQFIRTGNIPFGFVAKSLVIADHMDKSKYQEISKKLYTPIEQGAVILKKTKLLKEVELFFSFLESKEVREIILNNGYLLKEIADAK